jgi:dynein heavy chain
MLLLLLQVRKYLHVVLCFSPVGDKFRIRARQFPALVNCTQFDWFHGWPSEALISVAQRFLAEVPNIEEDVRGNIALHMAHAHQVSSCWEWGTSAVPMVASELQCCPHGHLQLFA